MPRVPAPTDGLVEGTPSQDQLVGTSFSIQNIRPFDTVSEKRVGKRPGTTKAFTTQIVGDFAVINIAQITTTYIIPE